MEKKQSYVVTGLSGGIDSSAAALLLKRQGHKLVGITLKLWEYAENAGSSKCCTPEDVRDARRVAFAIDIPFYVRDYSKLFAEEVVDYFTDAYLKGQTPNPCAMCNDKIKFTLLDLLANDIEADYIATGHYARIHYDKARQEYELWRGVDTTRDQSYFLFRLNQPRLKRTLFPLGELTKNQVRELLREAKVGTPDKPESRELCFVENDRYMEFVEARARERLKPGNIVDAQSQALATHEGIHRFTVGQRKGIGVAAPEPLYVTRIDAEKNEVVVGPRQQASKESCEVHAVSWISQGAQRSQVQVQLRYRATPIEARLEALEQTANYRLHFLNGREIPTPGQAAVFYDGDRVLGGGWIQ